MKGDPYRMWYGGWAEVRAPTEGRPKRSVRGTKRDHSGAVQDGRRSEGYIVWEPSGSAVRDSIYSRSSRVRGAVRANVRAGGGNHHSIWARLCFNFKGYTFIREPLHIPRVVNGVEDTAAFVGGGPFPRMERSCRQRDRFVEKGNDLAWRSYS